MGVLRREITLPAAKNDLWKVFADLSRLGDWLTLHVKFKSEVPKLEDYKEGLQVTQVISMMGMPNTIEWTVAQFTDGESCQITGTGMAGVKVSFTFSVAEADGITTGKLDAEFKGQIIVGALGKAVEKQAGKELNVSLEKLGDLMVTEGVLPADQRDKVEIKEPVDA
ncbi:SRPBCC family protein [Pseudonocardiaceae bacterium YIM PH 21723]|nr:SRPBCC family protein [Pseudonocardiaceae bacterium YIM PH 21723]